MPIVKDMIATTGTTTPVIALSFAVKLDEVISGAELIVGVDEMLVGVSDGDDVDVSEVAVAVTKVAFTTGSSGGLTVTCPMISSGDCPFSQFENPRNELNIEATLAPKALVLALPGLVMVSPGSLLELPLNVMQNPAEA